MDHESPIRAERRLVPFFEGLEVEGYQMPNGNYRVGIEGASLVIGYARNWLGRALSRGGSTVKVLRGIGFTEEIEEVVAQSKQGNDVVAGTISLDDFNRLIVYAVSKGKRAALALQLSLTRVALNDFFRDAFGEPPLSIEEKRKLFYEAYAATISPEGWRQMDRKDILKLALPGDEPHLQGGNWNAWDEEDEL
jgi:2-polyprenyl-6-methoxyphenol hydroxylase-like FAD-dependent oxidoreductase